MQVKIIEVSCSLVISRTNFISDVMYRQIIRQSSSFLSSSFLERVRVVKDIILYEFHIEVKINMWRESSVLYQYSLYRRAIRCSSDTKNKWTSNIPITYVDSDMTYRVAEIQKKKLNHSFLNLQISFSLIYEFPAIAEVNDLVYISQWILT